MIRPILSRVPAIRFGMLFALAIMIAGCNKGVVGPGGGGGGGGGGGQLGDPFIQLDFAGQEMDLTPANGWEEVLGSSGGESWSYSSGFYNEDLMQSWAIELGNIVGAGIPSDAQFTAMFAEGPRDYVGNVDQEFGVSIFHQLSFGEEFMDFSTACGEQPQDATFNITDIETISGGGIIPIKVKIEGDFSATLYPCPDGGGGLPISGTFVLLYDKMY